MYGFGGFFWLLRIDGSEGGLFRPMYIRIEYGNVWRRLVHLNCSMMMMFILANYLLDADAAFVIRS